MQVLLHQQHADAGGLDDAAHGPLDVQNHRGLDAFGGLIEQEQLGLAQQRPGDRQLLLLTAGEVAAAAAEELLQDREQLENDRIDVTVAGQAARQGLHAEQQVFAHRELGNDLPALGHVADAPPGAAVGRQGRHLPLLQVHRTAALAQQADHGLEQGGLADPIAADQAHHLTRLHGEVHIAQDVALAVIHVQPLNLERGRQRCSAGIAEGMVG